MISPLNEEKYISGYDIKNSLTIDDVVFFLESLGVKRIEKYNDHLVCPTICHHTLDQIEEASMKLYYYQKDRQFWCYTGDCGSMTIFNLYQKFMKLNYHEVTYKQALEYITKCIKHISISDEVTRYNDEFIIAAARDEQGKDIIGLKEYNKNVLSCFNKYYHPSWLKENISKQTMDKFGILFSINENKIIIPQLDIDGRLVGIRARTLDEEDILDGKKYMPVKVGSVLYNHPTSYNLYGIYEHKQAIERYKRAIIFEGEKSVLKHDTFYGNASVAVAMCGSQLNKYQINLLIKKLNVCEIILAFDKENKSGWREKIIKLCQKYSPQACMSYVYDEYNILKDKDSPIDKGKDVWEKLFRKRIIIKG